MFPKNENKGQIKGCGCANGKYQRKYTTKEDLSVPAVAIKFVMMYYVINAVGGRGVATIDILELFMQADIY